MEKILDLKEEIGRTPSRMDFISKHRGRYMGSILYQHGSWSNAVRKLGLQTREDLRRVDRDKLIAELREYHDRFKKIPLTSDFNRGFLRPTSTYLRHFSTLNEARVAAGLNAVLANHFGSGGIMELTPEQYLAWQDGHSDVRSQTAGAIRSRRHRARKKRERQLKDAA